MGDYGRIGEAFVVLFWVAAIAVPLGVWKLVEILIWVFQNLHWGV
jgi:hypothetical protein